MINYAASMEAIQEDKIFLDSNDVLMIGDYLIRSKLGGKGSASTVWKAEHKESGEMVALKQIQISKLTRNLKNCLDSEINFLSSVNHPNIVRLLDVFKTEGWIFLILEFCTGGNLATYIQKHGRVPEYTVKLFMQQLAAGLRVLKSHKIIHRDLKPEGQYARKKLLHLGFLGFKPNHENILLSSPNGETVLKISDFGLSRILQPGNFAEMVCGTSFYMAPEILQFQRYNEKADMWSVGAILFELLNGYPPFQGRSNVQILKTIKESKCLPFSPLTSDQLPSDCIDMCCRLLSIYPEKRLSFDEFYDHDFLRKENIKT